MSAPDVPETNRDQIEFWNGLGGAAWVRRDQLLDQQLAPLGRLAMEEARLAEGLSVLDVGCGCGGTTVELGRRVGSNGSVVGLDVSAPMLARARDRATEEKLGHVSFVLADAQTADLGEGRFDRVYSRFALMFFESPETAFSNLRRSLCPGGRLSFICWQPLDRNPWLHVPLMAAAEHVAMPPRPPPGTPGPFSLADPERIRRILGEGGLTEITITSSEGPMAFAGGDLEAGVELALDVGPLSRVLREAQPDDATRARIIDAIRTALEAYRTDDGIALPAAAWIVTAERPS